MVCGELKFGSAEGVKLQVLRQLKLRLVDERVEVPMQELKEGLRLALRDLRRKPGRLGKLRGLASTLFEWLEGRMGGANTIRPAPPFREPAETP